MIAWAFMALGLMACAGDKGPGGSGHQDDTASSGDDGGGDVGSGSGSGGDTGPDTGPDTGENPMVASVGGGITLELVKTGEDGSLEPATMTEVFGDEHPFGSVWIGAYKETEQGGQEYFGTTTIHDPVIGSNAYEISIEVPTESQIYIFAVLDENDDHVISPADPLGVYPNPVLVYEGVKVTSVDIDILVNIDAYLKDSEKGQAPPGAATPVDEHGNPCETTNISGEAWVDTDYLGGDAAVFLSDELGQGPVQSVPAWFPLVARGDDPGEGATGNYVMQVCQGAENVSLLGVYDADNNGLSDPADIWGAYLNSEGKAGNPFSVEASAKTNMTVQIPLSGTSGSSSEGGLSLVPFVHLTGTLSTWDGAFSTLPSGSRVLVTALKYRPNQSVSYETIEANAYDLDLWEWPDIEDEEIIDWRLTVPASTIVYLWAYADEDADLIFNESGEHVDGGGDDSNGTVVTGDSSSSGHDLRLGLASG